MSLLLDDVISWRLIRVALFFGQWHTSLDRFLIRHFLFPSRVVVAVDDQVGNVPT